MSESNTITMKAESIMWAAKVALTAASKDDVTPVLTGVLWMIKGGKVSLIATDRYRVHEATVSIDSDIEGEFLMPRRQVEWLLRSQHKPARLYPDQHVRVTWIPGKPEPERTVRGKKIPARIGPGRVTLEVLASDAEDAPVFAYAEHTIAGKFPPVARLFPEDVKTLTEKPASEVYAMKPQLLADLRPMVTYRGESLHFHAVRVSEKRNYSHEAMFVTNRDKTARALLQPGVIL